MSGRVGRLIPLYVYRRAGESIVPFVKRLVDRSLPLLFTPTMIPLYDYPYSITTTTVGHNHSTCKSGKVGLTMYGWEYGPSPLYVYGWEDRAFPPYMYG